jgi:hypothetical protein
MLAFSEQNLEPKVYVSVGLRRPSNTAYRLEVPVDMDCSTPKRTVSNLTVLMTVVPVAQWDRAFKVNNI